MCDNNDSSDCNVLLLQARETIVECLVALCGDGCEVTDDASCAASATLADLAQQLADSCPRSGSAEYLSLIHI